jgi:NADH:ubiquinone oxidoreductase subunit D
VLFNELTRIQSHLVWLGTHAMDIGALTVFLYCFREREQLLRIFEAVSGQRMMTSYVRIGGLSLEPPRDLYARIRTFLKDFPSKIDEYEGLLQGNPIWMGRLKGVGYLSPEDAIALGVTGPPLRASGVDFDVRRDMPYSGYEKFQFNVPVSNIGDVWARYIVRMQEFRESVKICLQALDGLPEGSIVADAPKIILPNREQMKTQMESLIHHFKIVTEGFGVPAGEATSSVEAPHGMMNYYVVSDGTAKPYGAHMCNPDRQLQARSCAKGTYWRMWLLYGSIDIAPEIIAKKPLGRANPCLVNFGPLASLLRSYAADHGLKSRHQRVVEVGADEITFRVGSRWLRFTHETLEDSEGHSSSFNMQEDGTVKLNGIAEEMDLAAERLAREMMQRE